MDISGGRVVDHMHPDFFCTFIIPSINKYHGYNGNKFKYVSTFGKQAIEIFKGKI